MIDAYAFGTVTVDGRTYSSDVIIYPDHVDPSWWRKEGHNLSLEDLEGVLHYDPEVLVIGQGKPGLMNVSRQLVERIREQGIEVIMAPTAEAVRRYNELAGQKKVVATLHLTC